MRGNIGRLCLMGAVLAAMVSSAAAEAALTIPRIDSPALRRELLDAHNRERRALGIPDLNWSDDLAEDAAKWAARLAKTGVMVHDSQRSNGENIWMAKSGRMSPTAMVGGWLAEKKWYKPGSLHPNISTTGRWTDVGHYTAIVWSTTTVVGCSIARGALYDFLVCRYAPMGNTRGLAAYDVSTAQRAAAAAGAAASAKGAKKAKKS